MKFFCISDKESSLGFKFSGIEVREVSEKNEAKEVMKEVLNRKDIGIILITKKVSSLIKEEMDKLIYTHHIPLILEIPSKGEKGEEMNVREFLKKAVGIRI